MLRIVSADVETAPILPGLLAPPLACLSWAEGDKAHIVSRDHAAAWMSWELGEALAGRTLIVGQNFAYDAVVLCAHDPDLLPLFFEAYQAGGIADTMLCEQLFDIARGELGRRRYTLDALAKHYLDRELDKSTWRMRYGTLIDTPIDHWPEGAKSYAIDDARATLDVFRAQADLDDEEWLFNAPSQAKYAFSQQLMCTWGIRTDPTRVASLKDGLELLQYGDPSAGVRGLVDELLDAGLLRREKGKLVKCTKVAQGLVTAAFGGSPPTTDKGGVSCDRDTLLETGDARLKAYADYVANEKLLSTYIPVLEEGTTKPINASFRLVETGRRGATKNMQTPPKLPGVRECYVPRPGFVFCSSDYDSLEFRCLGQVNVDLFGSSPIADMYQADPNADPHIRFAAEAFLNMSYEEALRRKKEPHVAEARQRAKAYNFGLPGGLGVETFIELAAAMGIVLSREDALAGKAAWIKTWHMQPFFNHVAHLASVVGFLVQLRSHRIRGGIGFCDAANCVDYETEALTQRGWVKGPDLRMSDILLTKNAATGELEWQAPTGIHLYPDYDGPLMEFRSNTFHAVTTPNHRWLISENHSGLNKCVTSEKLSLWGDHRIHRTGSYVGPQPVYSDDFIELVGWVLTDGSFPKPQRKTTTQVLLFQSQRANPRKVEQIDALLARLGIKAGRRLRQDVSSVVWSFTGPVGQQLRELFPDRVLTRRFLLTLSRDQAVLLRQTMLLGDGTFHKGHGRHILFTARDQARTDAFQFLCVLSGTATKSVWRDMSMYSPVSAKMKNIPKMNGVFQIAVLARDKAQVVKHQLRKFTEKRGVWCPTVPNGYFVARRSGTVYITGNSFFQGLAADGACEAHFQVAWACYAQPDSPLFGSRIVNFLHDELITEMPEHRAPAAAKEKSRLMNEAMMLFTPDVPITTSPALMRMWSKSAESVYDEDGNLMVWEAAA